MTPARVGLIAIVFTVVFAVAYGIAVSQNYALFTYHPVLGTIAFGVEKPRDGPAMYWYGWMTTAAIAALAACLIASVLPERLVRHVWSGWSWAAPVAVLCFFAWLLRGYFLR
jgi:hypothetical protein